MINYIKIIIFYGFVPGVISAKKIPTLSVKKYIDTYYRQQFSKNPLQNGYHSVD